MKKYIIISSLLLISFWVNAQSQNNELNKLLICEDKNIGFSLIYQSVADIGDTAWMRLQIINKSDKVIKLNEIDYSINKEKQLKDGEKYIDYGEYGRGSRSFLMHYYYELQNTSNYPDITIKPYDSIFVWKYMANYASVLIDTEREVKKEICALFNLKATYEIKKRERSIKSKNIPFCFQWIYSKNVPNSKLIKRLKDVILNPHWEWVNSGIIKVLMSKSEIIAGISTNDIIEGVIKRKNVHTDSETIHLLSELKKREIISNSILTEHFREMINNNNRVSNVLKYYWDNSLSDDLLDSKTNLFNMTVILELNSKYWRDNEKIKQKIYSYFTKMYEFDKNADLDPEKLKEWAYMVKVISISRHPEIIEYLRLYLNNEFEFNIEDWSKYSHCGSLPDGAKPDLIPVRVCDVAFVSLLRAYNQFDFEQTGKFYEIKIKDEILTAEDIKKLNSISKNIYLKLFEKELKLSNKLKAKILNY
ncbi:MAG: hypothetical protein K8R54_11295 [Bacteroidales bacterium]|nr:hypothetical protein [Bacteroidales bacterium]